MLKNQLTLSNFSFPIFTKTILTFLETQVSSDIHPSWAIVWLSTDSDKVNFGLEKGRSNFLEQLQKGHKLFFPFSSSCVEELYFASGQTIECKEDSSFNLLSNIDSLGFLVSLDKDIYTIEHAIHYGGCFPHPNNIEVLNNNPFIKEMDTFLSTFIDS